MPWNAILKAVKWVLFGNPASYLTALRIKVGAVNPFGVLQLVAETIGKAACKA